MKSLNCKSAVAFVMALCLVIPVTANIDNAFTNVNAVSEDASEDNQFTIDEYGNVNIIVGSNTSLKVELSSEPGAGMSGAIMYWDNDLSDNVTILWEASTDENGKAIINIDDIPEEITSITLQVYYCAYWDSDISDMVNASATVVSTSPYIPQPEDTTISEEETSETQSNITKDEYGNIHISMNNADSVAIEILSHAWAGCNGAIGYWNNSINDWETIDWSVDNCDENGNAIIDITGIPTDVTDIQFQIYYCAYWDNDAQEMVGTSLEVVNANPYLKSTEETTTEDTTTTPVEVTTTFEEEDTTTTSVEVTTTSEEEDTTTTSVEVTTTSEEEDTTITSVEVTTTSKEEDTTTTSVEVTTTSKEEDTTTTSVEVITTSKKEDTTNNNSLIDIVLGDVTCDGNVKSNDLLLLKKYLLGLEDLDTQALANADLTGDNQVKSNDLLALKKQLLGLDET